MLSTGKAAKGLIWAMAASGALALAILSGSGVMNSLEAQSEGGDKTPVFLNITSGQDDLHAVCMGLGLAKNALAEGHTVVVFLNVHAPVFASTELPEDLKFADFPPVKVLVSQIIEAGGKVLVCGHCARLTSVKPDQLIPGVTLAEHGELFRHLPPHNLCFSY